MSCVVLFYAFGIGLVSDTPIDIVAKDCDSKVVFFKSEDKIKILDTLIEKELYVYTESK
jgi:hypothetical protein